MNKAKLVRSWAALGEARPSFDEYEWAMTRPVRLTPCGSVDAMEFLGWVFREENCWAYFKLRHAFCSRRVARLKAAERRPRYYAAENERRRALAAERRKIRARTTTNACPTRESVLETWNRRRDSHEAAIRFGSLLEDLECYLDNSLRRDEHGVIVGRNPGVKGWLCDNIPEILDKYTTAMRYKAAAKKLKQVAELADPTPADVVLPRGETAPAASVAGTAQAGTAAEKKWSKKQDYGADEVSACRVDGGGEAVEGSVEGEVPELAVVRARAIWLEVVYGIGQSATALMRRLDELTDPARVEDANMLAAWRGKYMNEITVRTKKRWWRRLVKAAVSGSGKDWCSRRKKVA